MTRRATRDSGLGWWSDHYDDYDTWLAAGSAGEMARLHGLDQVGFATKVMQHPAYDEFWQDQAVDKILGTLGVTVPVMLVHSLWDQEDIYGNIAVWKALHSPHADTSNLFLVLGPWYHHQERLDGSHVGAIEFGSDTGCVLPSAHTASLFGSLPQRTMRPRSGIAPVTAAFETGTNRWLSLPTWPAGCESACGIDHEKFYLQPGGGLGVVAPVGAGFESYVSDPAKPIPYIPRPIHIAGESERDELANLVGQRPARRGLTHRCAELQYAAAHRTSENQW